MSAKPAVIVREVDKISDYVFSASSLYLKNYWICSNSLINLKRAVKDEGWISCFISRWDDGYFSIQQTLTKEIYYRPKYH